MLMVDRVPEISRDGSRGRIVAERDVQLDDWFFQSHFLGDPVQPGCLGARCRLAAARLLLQLGGRARLGARARRGRGRVLGSDPAARPAGAHGDRRAALRRAARERLDDRDRRRAAARRRRGDLHDQAGEDGLVPRHRLPRATRIRAAAAAAERWSDERDGQRCSRPAELLARIPQQPPFRFIDEIVSVDERAHRGALPLAARGGLLPRPLPGQPGDARRAADRIDGAGRPGGARPLPALEGARRPRRPRSW